MRFINLYICIFLYVFLVNNIQATSYNSYGQTGIINLPSAEIHNEQSLFFTFSKTEYTKLGVITVTPFEWMEASYFYYRPDDLYWGAAKGLYLDKGFNVKFLYKPRSILMPNFALGLDDFAGTGQFTREYIAATYNFNRLKLTSGIGWGKYVGESSIKNPFSYLNNRFETRRSTSNNYQLGGSPSYDLWFRGPSSLFGGVEIDIRSLRNLSLKIESDPFDYFKFGCCGEGLSFESQDLRKKDSKVNFGFSYKYRDFGNVNLSYTKGNTWNLAFSFGFSSKKDIVRKDKFNPRLSNTEYQQNKKDEFYLDLLENLNNNKLYLQTAHVEEKNLGITIESEEHFNPIIYSSRAAFIANEIAIFNDYDFDKIEVGHINRGVKINSITFRPQDLDLDDRYPNVLIKRRTNIKEVDHNVFQEHEFRPIVNFPVFMGSISPDIKTHIGSPQRFAYVGIGLKFTSELQLNRNLVVKSTVGRSFKDNFYKKVSDPNTSLPPVRTEVVDYLQGSSNSFYLSNLDIENIWSPAKNLYAKINLGYLEYMYGGISTELAYKPFNKNLAFSIEYNKVRKREYDQRFSFLDYEVSTSHLNLAYYHPQTNILTKWSYGKYLAQDEGFTIDISRRMPSGWRAGFFFSQTNVSAEQFGEGSFDKGFYFNFPINIFSKEYTKDISGFSLRTMTRDGGQKLELKNRLIDSFYGSTYDEINENWNNYLD
tara:strand:+ start:1004 stop:3127 length:2124 start_codon:yes stop_codon:yes gene_type:complete